MSFEEDKPGPKDGTYWALKMLYEVMLKEVWTLHDRAEEEYQKALMIYRKNHEEEGKDDFIDDESIRYSDVDAARAYAQMGVLDELLMELSDFMRRLGVGE